VNRDVFEGRNGLVVEVAVLAVVFTLSLAA
jgi:hypothetical protein